MHGCTKLTISTIWNFFNSKYERYYGPRRHPLAYLL